MKLAQPKPTIAPPPRTDYAAVAGWLGLTPAALAQQNVNAFHRMAAVLAKRQDGRDGMGNSYRTYVAAAARLRARYIDPSTS